MLKTTNYYIEEKKLLLPVAYGAITNLDLNGHIVSATIAIQDSRENCELVRRGEIQPLHIIKVRVPIENYNEHIFSVVYDYAKSQVEQEKWDGTKYVVKQPFYGWDDDIITE